MRAFSVAWGLLALVFGLAGCVPLPGSGPSVASSVVRAVDRQTALEVFLARRARLFTVGWHVRVANGDICYRRAPGVGIGVVDALSLPGVYRSAAEARFGAGVMVGSIVPFSPADGLLWPGDLLVAVNGVPTPTEAAFRARLAASRATVARFDVRRGSRREVVLVSPVEVCALAPRLVDASEITAWTDGRDVAVTVGMMRFASNDEELAQVIGHEFAHALLGHNRRRLLGGHDRSNEEMDADYLGLFLAGRAGYEVRRAPQFWSLLSRENAYHGIESRRRLDGLKGAVRRFETLRAAHGLRGAVPWQRGGLRSAAGR